ncbi:MAG TPA: nicotinamidase [Acidobacteriaceae bacterium]|jgi:nicotinamidase/pyrazinamidase|nr:nicotinamidase [Acidobacteriaceae bacterium]
MLTLRPTDVLLVIDMQRDFLPSTPDHTSALPVAGGDTIIPAINALGARFDHVLCTQDWHPQGHISFASAHPGKLPYTDTVAAPYGLQTLWPVHCVQNTPGAALDPRLVLPHAELLLRKGFRKEIDSYSAFLENDHTTPTGLAGYLRERNLTRLFFCGLAYDFCVGFSALDGARLGFECLVLEDLSRPVALPATELRPATLDATNSAFAAAHIPRIRSAEIHP